MRIAVAGGTGLVGSMVVDELRSRGDEPVVLSRSQGVDLTSGAGLDDAIDGVEAVIDVSNIGAMSKAKAVRFFDAETRILIDAEKRAGVGHHIVLSIVGVDRVEYGYYTGKRRQEELALAGLIPATVLRATQFHEFASQMIARGGPFVIAPKMLSQPIAAREVASALAEIAHGEPQGVASELAGPQPEQMTEMIRKVLRARGIHKPMLPIRVPGAGGKAMASGGLLPTADGPRGTQTFDEWIASGSA